MDDHNKNNRAQTAHMFQHGHDAEGAAGLDDDSVKAAEKSNPPKASKSRKIQKEGQAKTPKTRKTQLRSVPDPTHSPSAIAQDAINALPAVVLRTMGKSEKTKSELSHLVNHNQDGHPLAPSVLEEQSRTTISQTPSSRKRLSKTMSQHIRVPETTAVFIKNQPVSALDASTHSDVPMTLAHEEDAPFDQTKSKKERRTQRSASRRALVAKRPSSPITAGQGDIYEEKRAAAAHKRQLDMPFKPMSALQAPNHHDASENSTTAVDAVGVDSGTTMPLPTKKKRRVGRAHTSRSLSSTHDQTTNMATITSPVSAFEGSAQGTSDDRADKKTDRQNVKNKPKNGGFALSDADVDPAKARPKQSQKRSLEPEIQMLPSKELVSITGYLEHTQPLDETTLCVAGHHIAQPVVSYDTYPVLRANQGLGVHIDERGDDGQEGNVMDGHSDATPTQVQNTHKTPKSTGRQQKRSGKKSTHKTESTRFDSQSQDHSRAVDLAINALMTNPSQQGSDHSYAQPHPAITTPEDTRDGGALELESNQQGAISVASTDQDQGQEVSQEQAQWTPPPADKVLLLDEFQGETRAALVKQGLLYDFECEWAHQRLKKGNIYRARIMRIEPSLQAAFVDYGEEKQGFLAFSEIHPCYYRNKGAAKKAQAQLEAAVHAKDKDGVEEDEDGDMTHRLPAPGTGLKIQDVLKRGQMVLVQVIKDARGHKGAALSTYVSLPGRYAVLMPNTPGGGGISKKVKATSQRDAMRALMHSLDVPKGSSLVMRASGVGCQRQEIVHDYYTLWRTWQAVVQAAGDQKDIWAPDVPGFVAWMAQENNTQKNRQPDKMPLLAAPCTFQAVPASNPADAGYDQDSDSGSFTMSLNASFLQQASANGVQPADRHAPQEPGAQASTAPVDMSGQANNDAQRQPTSEMVGGDFLDNQAARERTISHPIQDTNAAFVHHHASCQPLWQTFVLQGNRMSSQPPVEDPDAFIVSSSWTPQVMGVQALPQGATVGLLYQEHDLLVRALRDWYRADVQHIHVQGLKAYQRARAFVQAVLPQHLPHVYWHDDVHQTVFEKYGVQAEIDGIHSPTVFLPSGGSVVINPTEALVAIDVNSAKSTQERNAEDTAFKTNIQAAEVIARHLRLRDLGGLIVIDFIDMGAARREQVEKVLKDALKPDRARIKVGKISGFGLLEMSRQRMRQSLVDSSTLHCPTCAGIGRVMASSLACVHILRMIRSAASRLMKAVSPQPIVHEPAVVLWVCAGAQEMDGLMNTHRQVLTDIEQTYGLRIHLEWDRHGLPGHFQLWQGTPAMKLALWANQSGVLSQPLPADLGSLSSGLHGGVMENKSMDINKKSSKSYGKHHKKIETKNHTKTEIAHEAVVADWSNIEGPEVSHMPTPSQDEADNGKNVLSKSSHRRHRRRKKNGHQNGDNRYANDQVIVFDRAQDPVLVEHGQQDKLYDSVDVFTASENLEVSTENILRGKQQSVQTHSFNPEIQKVDGSGTRQKQANATNTLDVPFGPVPSAKSQNKRHKTAVPGSHQQMSMVKNRMIPSSLRADPKVNHPVPPLPPLTRSDIDPAIMPSKHRSKGGRDGIEQVTALALPPMQHTQAPHLASQKQQDIDLAIMPSKHRSKGGRTKQTSQTIMPLALPPMILIQGSRASDQATTKLPVSSVRRLLQKQEVSQETGIQRQKNTLTEPALTPFHQKEDNRIGAHKATANEQVQEQTPSTQTAPDLLSSVDTTLPMSAAKRRRLRRARAVMRQKDAPLSEV